MLLSVSARSRFVHLEAKMVELYDPTIEQFDFEVIKHVGYHDKIPW